MVKYNGYIISCYWGIWYTQGKEFDTLEECKDYIDYRENL